MDLKTARLRKNMTQAELAQVVGVTVAMTNHYENGKHLPRPGIKRKIEAFLGPVEWPEKRKQQHLKPLGLEKNKREATT
jgi:transcriptional regulator with XRE-family HTH domain